MIKYSPAHNRNHAVFAKPICKGRCCRWYTYYCTLRKDYN